VGTRHRLAALAHHLVVQGQPVLWTSTATLVHRLLAAKRDLRLPHALAQLDRVAFLVLDDSGYVQHDQDEMEVLFAVLSERYERRSVGISTNLVFSDWVRIFKSPLTTMAAIDRVGHHSVILDLMAVASYRAHAALAQQRAQHQPTEVRSPKEETAMLSTCPDPWPSGAPATIGHRVGTKKQHGQRPYKGMKMGGTLRAWLVVPGSKNVGAGEPIAKPVEKAGPGAPRIIRVLPLR
jgi:hypothetical protein